MIVVHDYRGFRIRADTATVVIAAFVISTMWLSAAASATTLIAYRTDTDFVIAIDSLRVLRSGASKGAVGSFTACKAFEEHQAIFAFAGTDPVAFDPRDTVRQALQVRTSIRSAADIIAKRLSEQFEGWLPHITPQLLADIRRGRRDDEYATISTLALGAYESSGPVGLVIDFLLAPVEPPNVTAKIVWSCDTTACPEEMTISGEINKIVEYFKQSKASSPDFKLETLGATAADRAAALVRVEINSGTSMVGAPVSVARVSASGVSWPYVGKCARRAP